jgi:DNA-directed RNA polymerase subunit RPC12/RpoP
VPVYALVGGGFLLLGWYLVAQAWAASVAKHRPELHEAIQRSRYGWRCPNCGQVEAPACQVNNCGGPLVWVQGETRIKCSRCHRYLIPHPMLFRQTPRPRRRRCPRCGWRGKVREWKVS